MKTFKNISKVLFSSLVSFGSSFVIGFILPIYLTVYEYGMYRNFILYINFYYVLNFGYNEGLYIKYGGQKLDDLNKEKLKQEHRFTTVFQLAITILAVIIGLVLNDNLIILIGITSFFMNVAYYHMLLQQALAEFDFYTKSNIIKGVSTLIFMIVALFVFKGDRHEYYVLAFAVSQILTYIYLELNFYKSIKNRKDSFNLDKNEIYNDFNIGVFILFGNFLRILIGSIGQWIVNVITSVEKFAQYSLASSMISLVLLAVNAVSAVFYSIISNSKDDDALVELKDILLILGVISGAAIFVLKLFINTFLSKYIDSIEFMKYLLLGIPHIMVITIIINNLYKTKVSSKKYFYNMLFILLAEILLTFALYSVFNDIAMIAISTTVTYAIWYFYSTTYLFKSFRFTKSNYILLLTFTFVYLYSSRISNYYIGFAIYLVYIVGVLVFNRKFLMKIINKMFKRGDKNVNITN